MRRKYLLALAVATLALSTVGVFLDLQYLSLSSESSYQTVCKIRDLAMDYIRRNHSETEQFMKEIEWVGGVGDSLFKGGGWRCEISYAGAPNRAYGIAIAFGAPSGNESGRKDGYYYHYEVYWDGVYKDCVLTEIRYAFKYLRRSVEFSEGQRLRPLDSTSVNGYTLRDSAMEFLREEYPDAARLMTGIKWTGGFVEKGGSIGAGEYRFQSGGWVCRIDYTISATHLFITFSGSSTSKCGYVSSHEISWFGIYHEGVLYDKSYFFYNLERNVEPTAKSRFKNLYPPGGSWVDPSVLRDFVMEFIREYHPETEPFMVGIEWTPSWAPVVYGMGHWRFVSGGWKCHIHAVVYPNAPYGIAVTLSGSSIPGYGYEMVWHGVYDNGLLIEGAYVFRILLKPFPIRD